MLKIFAIITTFSMVNAQLGSIFTFGNGKIGVNFGGFKAQASLWGPGGISASAETPFGQKAGAGLGGFSNGNGLGGGLYAGAQSGFGQNAAAGLGGGLGQYGQAGGMFAGAQSGFGQNAAAGLAGGIEYGE